MKTQLVLALTLVTYLVVCTPIVVTAQAASRSSGHSEAIEALESGINAFRDGDYRSAAKLFRVVLAGEPSEAAEANAYFWLSKSAMAAGNLAEAERNLEYYLRTFPSHEFVTEAEYQRGRLLYLMGDYQNAIAAMNAFIERHPDSPYVANAIYWSGESLFELGRLDEAQRLFTTVVQDYPRSFRVEAARYRIELIDLAEREQELLRLLQWSHQEFLETIEDFERRESAYREAIASYQSRVRSEADEAAQEEIARLTEQVRTLQNRIEERNREIERLEQQLTTVDNRANRAQSRGGAR